MKKLSLNLLLVFCVFHLTIAHAGTMANGPVVANVGSLLVCPTISATTTPENCGQNDGSITVTATGGTAPLNYAINNGTPQASPVFNGLSFGDYSIKVTDATGCADSLMVTVPSAGGFTLTVTSTPATCPGAINGSLTVTPNGGVAPYSYSVDGGTPQTSNLFIVTGGAHSILVTDANGCTGMADHTVFSGPGLTVTATTIPPTCGIADGIITLNVFGGAAPYSYTLDSSAPQGIPDFIGLAAGAHTGTVIDALGCTGTITTILTSPGLTATSSSTASLCGQSTGSITITPTTGVAPYSFSLDGGAGQPNGTFLNVASGSHTIEFSDSSFCSGSLSLTVNEIPISATLSVTQPTCTSAGSIEVTGSDGVAPFTYALNGATPQASPIFDNLSGGVYTITVADSSACTYTEAVTIIAAPSSVTPSVSISASASTVCAGDDVTFTATATNGGANPQYQWMVNGANAGTNAASFTFNPTVNSDVSVQLTSSEACASPATVNSNVVSITVTSSQTPSITILGNTTVQQGTSTSVTSSVTNGGTAPAYQWQDSISTHTWANISGATNATLDYSPQQTGDGLRCVLISTATCTATTTVFSNALYFIVDPATSPRARLFPNPARASITIRGEGLPMWSRADIIDVEGRALSTIINSTSTQDVNLDVSQLPAGIYFIRLINRDGRPEYFKFLKQ